MLILGLIIGIGVTTAGAVFGFIKARQISNVVQVFELLLDEGKEAKEAIENAISDGGSLDAMKKEIVDVLDTLENLNDAIADVF